MNIKFRSVSWFFSAIIFSAFIVLAGVYFGVTQNKAKAYPEYSSVWTDNVSPWVDNAESAGTRDKPYLINNARQLAQLAKNVNSGTSYAGVYFQLGSNIDLTGNNWIPIGNADNPFKGILWGAGRTIKNMTIDSSRMNATSTYGEFVIDLKNFRQYLGLFGYVENNGTGTDATTVNQLIFENPYINASEYTEYAGVVAGYYNGINLTNITIRELDSENGNASATILHQLSAGSNMTKNFTAGGLVGKLGSACTMNVSNNAHDNEISTNINSNIYETNSYTITLGGLVGENAGTIKESRRTSGEISSYIGTIGGIAGVSSGTIVDCYNAGKILVQPNLPEGVFVDNSLGVTVIGGVVGKNNGGTVKTENFDAVFGGIESQNVSQVFQTCRGSIGGIVGINRGTIENIKNTCFVKSTGSDIQFMGGICAVNGGIVRKCINLGTVGADGSTLFAITAVGGVTGVNDGTGAGNGSYGQGQGYIYGAQNKGIVGQDINAMYSGGIAGINASITSGNNISSLESGAVVNVVKNSGLVCGSSYTGGIVGWNFGRVYGAYNEGHICSTDASNEAIVGGVVGLSNGGQWDTCFNIGEVGSGIKVGGFVGQLEGTIKPLVRNCANYGNVTGESYIGGFVGYMISGDIQYAISISEVNITDGGVLVARGGLIGAVAKAENGAPSSNITLNNMAYSESIANYEDSLFESNLDNGMTAVGNAETLFREFKYDSYSLTRPKVESMQGNQYYYFYNTGDMGTVVENSNWYFETANVDANTYYYPILRAFKSGESNGLGVYATSPTATKPTDGLDYPSEKIYKITFNNLIPYWNNTAKDYNKVEIIEPQYVVRNHYVAEPTNYDKPAGFYMTWKQSASDMLTDASDWSFDTKILRNLNIFIEWTEKEYNINYYLQVNGTGEFIQMSSDEVLTLGLNSSSTYSLNPDATATLNTIIDNVAYGYSYNGWWISTTASGIGDSLDEADKRLTYNRNEVFPEDIIYVYGTKTAKVYNVFLHPGRSNSNTQMNFIGKNAGEAITIQLTYGESYDLSMYTSQLDFNPENMSFKGWFNQEGSGGTAYTGSNSLSLQPFNLTGLTQIRFYAQWTDKFQKVYFVSIDENGITQELTNISVPYESSLSLQQVPTLFYYVLEDMNGYKVSKYYTDSTFTNEFDFDNTQIVGATTIYVTWEKKKFSLRLNADGGLYSDSTNVYLVNNIEYKSNILNDVLNNLTSGQLPERIGYKVKKVNNKSIWRTQSGGNGLIISTANNNYLMPSYDLNLYIEWEVEEYQIVLVGNGGLFEGNAPTITIKLNYQTPLADGINNYLIDNNIAKPTQPNYGFRYWSLNSSGEEGRLPAAITNADTVPYQGTTVYAVWGKQYKITFQKVFYNDDNPWLIEYVFEGDIITPPDTSSADFPIGGSTFSGWKRFIRFDQNEQRPVYEDYEWTDPVTSDITFVGTWVPNEEVITPPDTSNALIIAVSIIAAIVVLLFIIILARSRKKGLSVNNKRLQTKNSKEKLEEIQRMEARRKNDNPFE